MTMDEQRIKLIFQKYLDRTLTRKEEDEWRSILHSERCSSYLNKLIDQHWYDGDASGQTIDHEAIDRNIAFITTFPQQKRKTKVLWPYWAAAAVLFVMGLSFYYFSTIMEPAIAVGGNKAFLITSTGKKIILEESESGIAMQHNGFTYIDGSRLDIDGLGDSKGVMVLTTPRGGQYKIRLADGTLVFLNADSKLTYPASFKGFATRVVSLEGEGYFEVAKDTRHPFMVEAISHQIQVLGTKFQVSNYTGEDAKTTLLEGSVQITTSKGKSKLTPNQQAIVVNGNIETRKVEAIDEVAWTAGEFVFNKESLGSIMKKLARWYAVEVTFEDKELMSEIYEGVVSRFSNIDNVLHMLESTNSNVRFLVKGNRVVIKRN